MPSIICSLFAITIIRHGKQFRTNHPLPVSSWKSASEVVDLAIFNKLVSLLSLAAFMAQSVRRRLVSHVRQWFWIFDSAAQTKLSFSETGIQSLKSKVFRDGSTMLTQHTPRPPWTVTAAEQCAPSSRSSRTAPHIPPHQQRPNASAP